MYGAGLELGNTGNKTKQETACLSQRVVFNTEVINFRIVCETIMFRTSSPSDSREGDFVIRGLGKTGL